MTTLTLIQRLKALEKEIRNSEVEVGIRQKQLSELKPKRQAIEAECLKDFGCPITELEALLARDEVILEAETLALEIALAAALAGDQQSHPKDLL